MLLSIIKQWFDTFNTRLSNLCKESINNKWNKHSNGTLGDDCPFCDEVKVRTRWCKLCICPPEICWSGSYDKGNKGYVQLPK